MARFLAIHNVSGLTEEQFREKLSAVSKWRPDRRTTILKVYGDLSRGKLVTECEAVEQEHFEDWIKMTGWPAESIFNVDLVMQVGNIWKLELRPNGRHLFGGQHRSQALPLIESPDTGPKARLSLLSPRLSPSRKYSSGPLNHSLSAASFMPTV